MTNQLRETVGQSVMLSFDGTRVTPALVDTLRRTHACGVVLFSRNIESPRQLHTLVSELQHEAARLDLPPLLLGLDQEGGIVTRLPAPFVTMPSQMAQAATGTPAAAYDCAFQSARQLRRYGVNLNFAPVLDINCSPRNPVIGTRSFGEDAATAVEYGSAALRGYRDGVVIATAKHFPGHGDTEVDSHLGLPVVRHEWERLDRVELAPFAAAVRGGVPAIMSAHIVFPALDDRPATLSRRILHNLLRQELGFDGVVFTDALDMQAIAATYGTIEAGLLSKAAGADVLLPLGTLADQIATVEALAEAAAANSIPQAAFTATAERLGRLRAAYSIDYTVPALAAPTPEYRETALDVARRSVILVRGAGKLPLAPQTRLLLVDCTLPRFSQVEEAMERAALLREVVQAAFPRAEQITLGPEPSDDDIRRVREAAAACDAILLVTRNASHLPPQARLGQMLAQLDTPLVHAAVRSPYDIAVIPDAPVALLTYGDPEVSLVALVEVLAGTVEAAGSPPVRLTASNEGGS